MRRAEPARAERPALRRAPPAAAAAASAADKKRNRRSLEFPLRPKVHDAGSLKKSASTEQCAAAARRRPRRWLGALLAGGEAPPAERAEPPLRAARSWYAGYGTLTEEDDFKSQSKSPCPAVAASGGPPAARRALSRDSLAAAAAPLRPVNRLRSPSAAALCSRCSSALSLAGGSRYSLDAAGAFVPVATPLLCKLCLEETPAEDVATVQHCGCQFCVKCMRAYVEFEVRNGAYDISCPDAACDAPAPLAPSEIGALVGDALLQKHLKFRLNHDVVMDEGRAFCPRAGCETVCAVRPAQPVHCPTCRHDFCSECNQEWHAGSSCEAASGAAAPLLAADSELIKWCPMCRVPIEKDEGCAQMMCKRCKHVFCWYCLASLDDDFLLRHYDKGPCKNKLGHSRASVIWHRAQVVGIFAGFGLLLLVASPLLLLAAPCIVCCKCRLCSTNGAKKLRRRGGNRRCRPGT